MSPSSFKPGNKLCLASKGWDQLRFPSAGASTAQIEPPPVGSILSTEHPLQGDRHKNAKRQKGCGTPTVGCWPPELPARNPAPIADRLCHKHQALGTAGEHYAEQTLGQVGPKQLLDCTANPCDGKKPPRVIPSRPSAPGPQQRISSLAFQERLPLLGIGSTARRASECESQAREHRGEHPSRAWLKGISCGGQGTTNVASHGTHRKADAVE